MGQIVKRFFLRAIRFYQKFGFAFNGKEKQLPFGTELQMEMIS